MNETIMIFVLHDPWMQLILACFAGLPFAGLATTMLFRDAGPNALSILRASSWPPSHCPRCDTRLGLLRSTPLAGWVLSRGQCSFCGLRIPMKYPLAELAFFLPVLVSTILALGTPAGAIPALLSIGYPLVYLGMRGEPVSRVASALAAGVIIGLAPASLFFMALPYAAGALISIRPGENAAIPR